MGKLQNISRYQREQLTLDKDKKILQAPGLPGVGGYLFPPSGVLGHPSWRELYTSPCSLVKDVCKMQARVR